MEIYKYTHDSVDTEDIYSNVIYSIHKSGKQPTLCYTLFRKELKSDLIDMTFDGLHHIMCYITLPSIKAINNYKIAWDYNKIIKSINITFNDKMIETITQVIDHKLEWHNKIDGHVFSFKLPVFYSSTHSFFPLHQCKRTDRFKHIIEFERDIDKLIVLKNIEIDTICNFRSDITICNTTKIDEPKLEAYYVNIDEAVKNDIKDYIIERKIEIPYTKQTFELVTYTNITKLSWWNDCNWTTLSIEGNKVMDKLDSIMTLKNRKHEYNFSIVEDSRKHSNSAILRKSYIEFDRNLETLLQLTEVVKLKFITTDNDTVIKVIK